MLYLLKIIQIVFTTYAFMILIRVVGSWFPRIAHSKFMSLIAFYTDPYLNLFRRIIPPIGGVLDLSPLLGYLGLEFLQRILISVLFL